MPQALVATRGVGMVVGVALQVEQQQVGVFVVGIPAVVRLAALIFAIRLADA